MINIEDAMTVAEKAVSIHYVLSTLNFFLENVHFFFRQKIKLGIQLVELHCYSQCSQNQVKPSMGACDPSTREVEVERLGVEDHPQLRDRLRPDWAPWDPASKPNNNA